MNDQDRELVERIINAVGETGKHGFESLVRYQITDGILSAICFAIGLAGALWCFRRLLAWKIGDSWDADMQHIPRGIGLVVCAIAAFLMLAGIQGNIVQALHPEASIIKLALSKVGS